MLHINVDPVDCKMEQSSVVVVVVEGYPNERRQRDRISLLIFLENTNNPSAYDEKLKKFTVLN